MAYGFLSILKTMTPDIMKALPRAPQEFLNNLDELAKQRLVEKLYTLVRQKLCWSGMKAVLTKSQISHSTSVMKMR
jgi:hypothetical protein